MENRKLENTAAWERLEQTVQGNAKELYEPEAIPRSKSIQHIKVGGLWLLVGVVLTVLSCYFALQIGYVAVFTGAIITGVVKIGIGAAQLMNLDIH